MPEDRQDAVIPIDLAGDGEGSVAVHEVPITAFDGGIVLSDLDLTDVFPGDALLVGATVLIG